MFESVIIGSSPQLILTAIKRAQNGKKVLLVEKSNVPGGAWKTVNFGGYNDIEIGPHFLKPYKYVYENLLSLGVELNNQLPQPIYVVPTKKFGAFRFNFSARRYFQGDLNIGLINLVKIWTKTKAKTIYKPSEKYMYFKGGSGQFIATLLNVFIGMGGKVLMGSRVTEIDNHKEYLDVKILCKKSERIIKAKNVYLSRSFDLFDGLLSSSREPNKVTKYRHHEILVEYIGRPPNFSFILVGGDVHLIRMVSVQKVNKKSKRHILAIRLNEKVKTNKVKNKIHKELIDLSLIEKSSKISAFKNITYEVGYLRDKSQVETLKSGNIHILQTYELSNWLKDYFFEQGINR